MLHVILCTNFAMQVSLITLSKHLHCSVCRCLYEERQVWSASIADKSRELISANEDRLASGDIRHYLPGLMFIDAADNIFIKSCLVVSSGRCGKHTSSV